MSSTVSPFGIFSFPHLYVPRAPSPNADPRHSVVLIFDEDAQNTPEYKEMRKAAINAAKEKWGDNASDMIKNGRIRMPFRDAATKSQYAGYEDGGIFVNFWSNNKPEVIDGSLKPITDPSIVYPGCKGRVTYNAFAYENSGNMGVSFGLNNVQVTDFTTKRLDSRVAADKEFDSVATKGLVKDMPVTDDDDDDDLPF